MPKTIARPVRQRQSAQQVRPSIPRAATPFTLAQELEPFGQWADEPIWVPPKDSSKELAESMLGLSRPFTSKARRWEAVVEKHRADFTQVREFDLFRASIRLPKGKFFVTVTEQKDFDKIEDTVPACVQTRLDEFLTGPGKKRGVKVYYLKPLCVEVEDKLILTTGEDVAAAVKKIQDEVFAEYRQLALYKRPLQAMAGAANAALAVPRECVSYFVNRRQKAIEAYHAHLEFKRRKTALSAARTFKKCRTSSCSFDDMLELTNEIKRADVIEQYCDEQELSQAKRKHLLRMASGMVPWFVALAIPASYLTSMGMYLVFTAPPVMVCDPAFVAEMPDAPGTLLKIGHFDEVDGVTHVEI